MTASSLRATPRSMLVAIPSETPGGLDGNHPLAGEDLVFDVTVVAVEAAVPEELEHGHPH